MLAKKEAWQHIFNEFSLTNIQKVDNWPKLVAHGVPAAIPIEKFENEALAYNKVLIKGQPRWLTGTPKKQHVSLVFSVATEDEKKDLKKNGITIGGCLLIVVYYKSMTSKTQCRRCLKYGHLELTCTKPAICGYCADTHHTSKHSCATCNSSNSCEHTHIRCANCKSDSHNAFERQKCELYKAISC